MMGNEGDEKKLTVKDCLIFLSGCLAGVMSAMAVIAATEPAPSYGGLDTEDEAGALEAPQEETST